jgi:hypothetical protein
MLTQAMQLFFPVRGSLPGGEGNVELIGSCACGGLLQMSADLGFEPPRRAVRCSSSAVGACTAGLGLMPLTPTIRDFQVC